MNTITKTILAVVTVVFALNCQPATAQTDSKQDAFSQTPIGKLANGLKPANWKMPKFSLAGFKNKVMPTTEERQRMTAKKDGLFSEVGQSARKSWARTKDALNPKRLLPTNFMGGNQSQPSGTTANKPGFFKSLFSSQQQPASQSASVIDFLRQDRVDR